MLFSILIIHFLFAWTNWTIPCVPSANTGNWLDVNSLNTFTSNAGLGCLTKTDTNISPNFFILIYFLIDVCFILIFATNRGRRAFIGVQFLALLVGGVMIGAGYLPPVFMGAIYGTFLLITVIILAMRN